MATIKISVTGEICTVAQKVTFTAGSYGVYVAEVTTDASWDDLALVLCIISAPPGYPRMPNSGRCIKRSIPIKDGTAELDETIQPCMVSDNAILIGLLGCDADGKITRYSTVSAAGKVCGSGCIDDTILGDESRWAELISYINATINSLIGVPTDEQVRSAVDAYADEHGITTGATAEEAAQIEQNTTDITDLKSDLSQLSEENAALKSDIGQLSEEMKNLDVRSIADIQKTASELLVDTYTITYTDGTSSTFKVTNGSSDEEYIASVIKEWLDEHPEATTTVQDGAITEAKLADDVKAKLDSVKPQWAEFPRETNPSRDIYNRTAMDNAFELGTSGTLRHNALVEGGLITWTESTTSSDTASGSSGGVDVKIKHVYDYFGIAYKQADPWGANHLRYTDDVTVFPSGESIYGADGSIIDTVVATSDSTIINIGSSNYIILAYCRGNSDYHMVYRTASISSHTIALGETINVLTINGVEWDMTTLRSDYTNKLSQLNTKVINVSNVYYMAVVQSKVGIAIMKSSDGIDWSLHAHIADEDAYLEACLGCVSWTSNNMPTYYLVVRHQYGDGYLTLYGSNSSTFEKIISKVFIPAATGRAIIDSKNNKEAYLIYSVNGRKNAVLAKILPNSDGTTGISLLETPDNCISNYPCIYISRSSNSTHSAFIVGTNGINKNNCSVSVSYIWINNTDIEKEKNEQIKKVMFGTSVEVIQTLTEGTEIGSVAGTKLYAPSGGGSWATLANVTTTEEQESVEITFDSRTFSKIFIYAKLVGTETNTEGKTLHATIGSVVCRVLGVGAVGSSGTKYGRVNIDFTPEGIITEGNYDGYNVGVSDSPVYSSFLTALKSTTEVAAIKFTAGSNYGSTGGYFGTGTQFIVMAQ